MNKSRKLDSTFGIFLCLNIFNKNISPSLQWSATSCNKMAKRIVLSTKKALVVGDESRSQLFLQKKHKFTNLPSNALLYLI